MAYRVSMSELGIAGDERVFEGNTPGDVLEQLIPYLKKQHDIRLPEAGDILSGGAGAILPARADAGIPNNQGVVIPGPGIGRDDDARTGLILTRLSEKLDLRDSGLRADSDVDPSATTG